MVMLPFLELWWWSGGLISSSIERPVLEPERMLRGRVPLAGAATALRRGYSVTARLFRARGGPSADLAPLKARTANVANPRIDITAAPSPTSPVIMYRQGAP